MISPTFLSLYPYNVTSGESKRALPFFSPESTTALERLPPVYPVRANMHKTSSLFSLVIRGASRRQQQKRALGDKKGLGVWEKVEWRAHPFEVVLESVRDSGGPLCYVCNRISVAVGPQEFSGNKPALCFDHYRVAPRNKRMFNFIGGNWAGLTRFDPHPQKPRLRFGFCPRLSGRGRMMTLIKIVRHRNFGSFR